MMCHVQLAVEERLGDTESNRALEPDTHAPDGLLGLPATVQEAARVLSPDAEGHAWWLSLPPGVCLCAAGWLGGPGPRADAGGRTVARLGREPWPSAPSQVKGARG